MRGLKLVTGILLGVVLCAQLSFVVDGSFVQVAKADYPFGSDTAFPSIDTQTIQALFVQPATANQSLTKDLNLSDNNCAGENLQGILDQKNSITFPNLICLYGAAAYYLASGSSSGFGLAYSQIGNVIRDYLKDVPNAAAATAPTAMFDNSSGTTKFTSAGITNWNLLMGDPSLPVTSDKGGGYISRADAQLATIFKVFQAWQRWENTVDPLNDKHFFDSPSEDRENRQFRITGAANSVQDPTFSKGQYRPVEIRAWCGGSSVDSQLLNGDKDANGNPGDHRDCAKSATVDISYLDWTDNKGLWFDTDGISGYADQMVAASQGMLGGGGSIAIKGYNVDLTTPSIGTYGDTQFPSSNPAGEPLGSFITGEYKNVTRGLLDAKITVFSQETTLREIATNTGLSAYPLPYKFKLISQSTNGRCGNSSVGLDIVKGIKFAFCGLVDSMESLSLSFLVSSAHLLGKMVNIKPGAQIDDGGLGSFIVGLVPDQLTQGHLDDSLRSEFVGSIAQAILGLIASLTILICLIIALSGITQFGVNTYAVKKMLPGLLMGFFLAYLAVFAMRAAVEITTNLQNFITQSSNNADIQSTGTSELTMDTLIQNLAGIAGPSPFSQGLENMSSDGDVPSMTLVFKHGFLSIFLFAAGIMLFILSFLLAIRSLVILVLTCLSPLAFFSSGVGALNNIWSRWWKTASGWLFMPIVVNIWLWVAFRFFIAGTKAGSLGLGTLFNGLVGYGFGLFCIYMAMKTPFTLAGEASGVLNKWNSLGKAAWGRTGGAALKSAGSAAGQFAKDEAYLRTAKLRRKIATSAPVSKWRETKLTREHSLKDQKAIMENIGKENYDIIEGGNQVKALQPLLDELATIEDPNDPRRKELEEQIERINNRGRNRRNARSIERASTWHEEDAISAKAKDALKSKVDYDLNMGKGKNAHHHQHLVEQLNAVDTYRAELEASNNEAVRANLYGAKDAQGKSKEIVTDSHGKPVMVEKRDDNGNIEKDENGNVIMVPKKSSASTNASATRARNARRIKSKFLPEVQSSQGKKDDNSEMHRLVRLYNNIEPNANMDKNFGNRHSRPYDNENDAAFEERKELFKKYRNTIDQDVKARAQSPGNVDVKTWDKDNYRMVLWGEVPAPDERTKLKDMTDAAVDLIKVDMAFDSAKQVTKVIEGAKEMREGLGYANYTDDAAEKALDKIIALEAAIKANPKDTPTETELNEMISAYRVTDLGKRVTKIRNNPTKIYYVPNAGDPDLGVEQKGDGADGYI